VETVVAVTVGAIVMAAIFPIFLLLYRVETTWGDATQARASGLLAEESLIRDLRSYQLQDYGPGKLVLCSLDAPGEPTYLVTYSVDSGRLMRTVSRAAATVVAHGIEDFTATQSLDGSSVDVAILTTGVGGAQVELEPHLVVTPRNSKRCP
jgi:hypothetical protein